MTLSMHNRRRFLQMLAGAGAALPLARFFPNVAHAAGRAADRVVFFYVPDGMHEADWGTGGRQWSALGTRAADCTLLTGVRMDEDQSQEGHPGGAKRLLCGDADYGTSVDQFLARTVGTGTFFPHVYLGGIATRQGTIKTDEMISWKDGSPPAPEDNPISAFSRLFPNGTVFSSGGAPGSGGGGGGTTDPAARAALERRASVLDVVLDDLNDLRGALPTHEQKKLDRHLEATREVERRVKALLAPPPAPMPGTTTPDPGAVMACEQSKLDTRGLDGSSVFDATRFPDIVATQLDVLTQALACGVTRVATLQLSRHTSDLFMPFVPGDLKQQSHEASHNNQNVYLEQRVWLMQQYKGFLDRLAARPDPYVKGATLLDRTLVLFCTEINWGPTHRYTNMPFILAGGQGTGFRKGGALAVDSIHHRVHASIINAVGGTTQGWRNAPEPLPQLSP